jgi:hypothetical protein
MQQNLWHLKKREQEPVMRRWIIPPNMLILMLLVRMKSAVEGWVLSLEMELVEQLLRVVLQVPVCALHAEAQALLNVVHCSAAIGCNNVLLRQWWSQGVMGGYLPTWVRNFK